MKREKNVANRSLPQPCAGMSYVPYEMEKTACLHVVLSDKAYAAIISEVLRNGKNETGGVLVGRIYRRIWYVVDMIDSGLDTTNMPAFFQWDTNYVNHVSARISEQYHFPLTILGFWHRHPGSMDFFSTTDVQTIRAHLQEAANGLVSMLVNLDPELRMTFYWCHGSRIMPVNYDHGNEYFIPEFLNVATPEILIQRSRTPDQRVIPHRILSPRITAVSYTQSQASSCAPPAKCQSPTPTVAPASQELEKQQESHEGTIVELKKTVMELQRTAEEMKRTSVALANMIGPTEHFLEVEASDKPAGTPAEMEPPMDLSTFPADVKPPAEPASSPTKAEPLVELASLPIEAGPPAEPSAPSNDAESSVKPAERSAEATAPRNTAEASAQTEIKGKPVQSRSNNKSFLCRIFSRLKHLPHGKNRSDCPFDT